MLKQKPEHAEALKIKESIKEVERLFALTTEQQTDPDALMQTLTQIITHAPLMVKARLARARLALKLGDHGRALEDSTYANQKPASKLTD